MGALPSTNWHSFLAKNRNPPTKYPKKTEEENPAPFWGIFPGMPCKPATCSEGISNTNHHRHQPWIPEGPDSDQNDISHWEIGFLKNISCNEWSLPTTVWRLRPASSIQDQPTIPHTPLPPAEKEKSKLITSGCDLETRWLLVKLVEIVAGRAAVLLLTFSQPGVGFKEWGFRVAGLVRLNGCVFYSNCVPEARCENWQDISIE